MMYVPGISDSNPVNDSRESAMQSILPAFIRRTAASTPATSTWVAFGEALSVARKVAMPAARGPSRQQNYDRRVVAPHGASQNAARSRIFTVPAGHWRGPAVPPLPPFHAPRLPRGERCQARLPELH